LVWLGEARSQPDLVIPGACVWPMRRKARSSRYLRRSWATLRIGFRCAARRPRPVPRADLFAAGRRDRAARAHLRDTYPKYLADLFTAKAEAAKTRRSQRITPGRGAS